MKVSLINDYNGLLCKSCLSRINNKTIISAKNDEMEEY